MLSYSISFVSNKNYFPVSCVAIPAPFVFPPLLLFGSILKKIDEGRPATTGLARETKNRLMTPPAASCHDLNYYATPLYHSEQDGAVVAAVIRTNGLQPHLLQ